ncbi:MAG: segregation/condensation protein A [Candidatus Magasanikbacteria bacterium]
MKNNLQIQSKEFSGPLDLLLSLLDEKKMEISEISISAVTEPFLNYLESLEEIEAEELSDFLVVAAKLLLLKSRSLLPQIDNDEESDINLDEQLRLYRRFVEVSHKLHKMWLDEKKTAYPHIEEIKKATEIVRPINFSLETLSQSMVQLLKRLQPPKALPRTYIDKTITIKEKIDKMKEMLKANKKVSFKKLIETATSRTEVIVSFLAVLELIKQNDIVLRQDESFGDIELSKI